MNRVIGIDYVAANDRVKVCDMVSTPLDDASLDVAVFSLSLMGVNWIDYLKEAYRTLRPYGHLFIAEPQGRWLDKIQVLKQAVETAGFQLVGDVEQRYNFVYLNAVKG